MTVAPDRPPQAEPPILLGLDIGSGSVRALAFDARGRLLASGATETPTIRPQRGWAEFPADALWQALKAAVAACLADLPERDGIAGVGVCSVGESAFPIDAGGRESDAAIAWYDERTGETLAWLEAEVGADRLAAITGLTPDLSFGLCKVLWVRRHRPAVFAAARRWLHVADWAAWRLSGEMRTDPSLAARTLALDIRRRDWSQEILSLVGLPDDLYAPIAANGTRLGTIRPQVAAELGLPAGVAVGVGGHDHVLGSVAAGAMPGRAIDSMGTAETMLLSTDTPVFDPRFFARGYAQGAVDPGRPLVYVLGGAYTSGGAMEWARKAVFGNAGHASVIARAEAAAPGAGGVLFVPHLRNSAMPNPDAAARGAFLGLSADTTEGDLARAVYEGVAFEIRNVIEGLADIPGVPALEEIRAIGGGARNDLLLRIKASCHNRPILAADMAEATALGAALVGGVAAGVYPTAGDAAKAVAADMGWRTVAPVAEWADIYEERFRTAYVHAYAALRAVGAGAGGG
ncbi:MAG: L-fuculokinase [Alphaproteobacteria bacterium]